MAWVVGTRSSNGDFFLRSLDLVGGRNDLVRDKKKAHLFKLRPDAERASKRLVRGFVELAAGARWEVRFRIYDQFTNRNIGDLELVTSVQADDETQAVKKAGLKIDETDLLAGYKLRKRPQVRRRR